MNNISSLLSYLTLRGQTMISLTHKQRLRKEIIIDCLQKKMTNKIAASQLHISLRQFYNIKKTTYTSAINLLSTVIPAENRLPLFLKISKPKLLRLLLHGHMKIQHINTSRSALRKILISMFQKHLFQRFSNHLASKKEKT